MTHNFESRDKTTLEKALDINLDPLFYGSFAEIGAGQEVARQFFQAGKASQTIALTISAYDMTYSDIIYGKEKNNRYVCEARLLKMLDKEFAKLIDRLDTTRGEQTCFFAFADTVATANEGGRNYSHGWIGVRFQNKPKSEFSQAILHVRLLDKHRLQQQETLSKFGVNLLHSCFYKNNQPDLFQTGLFEQIKDGALAIDVAHFSGPAFQHFDEITFNINLAQSGWSEAIYIDEQGQLQNPADALWDKNILIQRGFFKPVTKTHLDISKRGVTHFCTEFSVKPSEVKTVFEFTLNNRLKNTEIKTDEALTRIKMIQALGLPVLVSKFTLFYKLKEFLRLTTKKPISIVIGATHLEKLFDESFYFDLSGGILEGMGKLLSDQTRLYIYPHKTKDICLLSKSFFPKPNVSHIYKHFIENKLIQDIAGCDEISEFIHSDDILKMIERNDFNWKKYVPEAIHNMVK